ncbi:hypothetical protein [Brevundimonas sp.]|uniref:hypothetical protein n=1 Tax=Brevundimonas sp. TaxID=1871086 RepID=UPI00286CCBE4|nr:hypothetical protein [Brevundimonas sp.]
MTTPQLAAPPPPVVSDDATVGRVSDLLIALERGDPRRVSLRPIADLQQVSATEACIFATVFIDAGDGRGANPFALHEVRLAAQCLAEDPPFPVSPDLASRLTEAALAAATAANLLQRSLN